MKSGVLESKYVWLVTPTWNRLHYVPESDDDKGAMSGWDWWTRATGDGGTQAKAICGVTAHFALPGIFSRMGLPRCHRCCSILQIPQGDGAPMNSHTKPLTTNTL